MKYPFGTVLTVLLVASLLSACAPAPAPTATPVPPLPTAPSPTPVKLEPIYVGLSLEFTGGEALSGQFLSRGAEMAVDEINKAGGIGGRKIEFVVVDNATAAAGQMDPAQTAANTRKLAADPKIVAILGVQSSTEGKVMLPIAAEARLALLSTSASDVVLSDPKNKEYRMADGKPVLFRTTAPNVYISLGMVKYARDKLAAKTFFLVDDGGAFGVGMCDAVETKAQELGIKVIGRDRMDPNAADYGVLVTKIKAAAPDALFLGTGLLASGKFAPQAKGRLNMLLTGATNVVHVNFIQSAGADAAEGWYGTTTVPNSKQFPGFDKYRTDFKQRYNVEPNDSSVMMYDLTYGFSKLLKDLLAQGKPITRETVLAMAPTLEYPGITGLVAFDVNGDVRTKRLTIWTVKKGELVYLDGVELP